MHKLPLALFAALLAVFVILLLKGKDPALVESPLIGKPAPSFSLQPALKGIPGFSVHDLRGKPALVNFFASWCLECQVEHNTLMRLSQAGAVTVYGIAYKDAPEKLAAWLKGRGNPYKGINADRDGRTAIDWGVYGVPETFVVDGKGNILYKHVGALTEQAYENVLKPLLEEELKK